MRNTVDTLNGFNELHRYYKCILYNIVIIYHDRNKKKQICSI